VAEGIQQTDPKLLEMAFVFHFNRKQLIRSVYVPSIAPFFMTAATTSLGLGWKAGVATEVLGRPPLSLGGSLYEAKIYLASADLLAYTCVVIIISLALERLLVWIFQRAHQFYGRSTGQAAGLPDTGLDDQTEVTP
jgi:NitT/TauT family transport system permease protein